MLEFLEFLLSSIGLTFVVTQFWIFKWFRTLTMEISPNFLGKLFKCPACFGFWAGLLIKLILLIYYSHPISIIIIILYGFINSICSYVLFLLLSPYMDKWD